MGNEPENRLLVISNSSETIRAIGGLAKPHGFDMVATDWPGWSNVNIIQDLFVVILELGQGVEQQDVSGLLRQFENKLTPLLFLASQDQFEHATSSMYNGVLDCIPNSSCDKILLGKLRLFQSIYQQHMNLQQTADFLAKKKKKIEDDQYKLKILTEAVSEPVIIVTQDLVVAFWNKEARNVFGYNRYEVVTESFTRWLIAKKSELHIKELFLQVAKTGARKLKRIQTFTMRNKLKVEFDVSTTVTYHKITDSEFNLVFVIHDIAKDRRLEKEVIRSRELKEENKLIRESARQIGKDYKIPLFALEGILHSLSSYESGNLTDRQREGLEILLGSSQILKELVADLSELSVLDSKRLKVVRDEFDFKKFLSEHKTQAYLAIKDKPVKLHWKISASVPKLVVADARKLSQIISTLLANSIKYTEKGSVSLSSHVVSSKLFVEISDTGIGIQKHKITDLFDLGSTDEESYISSAGTGVGLFICRKLVRLLNGEITVESEVGVGTVFRFYIDLPESNTLVEQKAVSSKQYSNALSLGYNVGTKLVLVVDDSKENAFFYKALNESEKYSVIILRDSKKAPAVIKDLAPDLLILKLEMPGIHGASIIRDLRNVHIKIPIIAISGYGKISSIASYNVHYLTEVISTGVLQKTIKQKIKWVDRNPIKGIVVYENNSWIKKVGNQFADFEFLDNKSPEFSLIQILQKNPRYLVVEDVKKSTNSIPLLLHILEVGDFAKAKEIILHYETKPMNLVMKKIAGYQNISLQSKDEIEKYILG